MSKELIVIESIVPEKAFVKGGLSSVLADIEGQIRPLAFDISTEKGRKEIASTCYKIKRHRAKINNEAAAAIVLAMAEVDEGNYKNAKEVSNAIVTAIAKGEIPNVSINY